MERILSRPAAAAAVASAAQTAPAPASLTLPAAWQRLVPLWRHVVWLMALFAVLAAAASVRLDVQQLRKDLDRNARAQRQARILNDRLRLEVDARRRAAAVEAVAVQLQMAADTPIVRVTTP